MHFSIRQVHYSLTFSPIEEIPKREKIVLQGLFLNKYKSMTILIGYIQHYVRCKYILLFVQVVTLSFQILFRKLLIQCLLTPATM